MRKLIVMGLLAISGMFPNPATAAGMRLERERLWNLESPETVGFLKARFDFQHNFKDYTLNPIVDLTLSFGIWSTVHLEIETLLHNLEASAFDKEIIFNFNTVEYGLKWAMLDQSKEDWFSLATGIGVGRTDTRAIFRNPAKGVFERQKNHLNQQYVYGVVHYDFSRFTQTLSLRYVRFYNKAADEVFVATVPGIGERVKIYEAKTMKLHLVADFQFTTFDIAGAENAWGAGMQIMYKSPHVFSFFLSNTFGDTSLESVFGVEDTFYNFRWSYRF